MQRENHILYKCLLKARKRPIIDDENQTYQRNLNNFTSQYSQQCFNEYIRIDNDNEILLQRINNVRGHLIRQMTI